MKNQSQNSIEGSNLSNNGREAEISLVEIKKFLSDAWKKLAISAIAGATLGFAGWFLLGSYQAQLYLENNNSLTLISLRQLQGSLPMLARQIIEKGGAPKGQEELYRAIGDPLWWKIAFTPVLSFTKADIKEFGLELNGDLNQMPLLKLNVAGNSKVDAIKNAQSISHFIRQGGAYLYIQDMLKKQKLELFNLKIEIDGKINMILVELEFQQARLKSLEALAKRFPGDTRTNSQVVDFKDSVAKYLPLSTQIIAINTEIYSNTESLERLRDHRLQLDGLKEWVAKAEPLITSSFNGLEINDNLLSLEEKQRATLGTADLKSIVFLDKVRADLLSNEAKFKLGLQELPTISVTTSSMIKITLAGSVGALLLMLFTLVSQRLLLSAVGDRTRPQIL